MKFLRTVLWRIWRIINSIRIILLNVIFFSLLIFILSLMTRGADLPVIEDGSLLVLNPHGFLVEEKTYISPADQFFNQAFSAGSDPIETHLYELVSTIDEAATDERISGIVLDLRHFMGGGLSKMQVVGDHLNRFREESGKPVIVYADYFTQNQYFLASHADKVYLNPMGAVNVDGFHYYELYFRGLLEKLKINPHIFQIGQFKSAVEPFMRDDMSDEAREANEAWLNELWTQYLNSVQSNRSISAEVASGRYEDFAALLERSEYDFAQVALNGGLVDELRNRESVREELINLVGLDTDKNTYRHVTLKDYQRVLEARDSAPTTLPDDRPQISIIVGRGAIMEGTLPAGQIGGDSLSRKLREARLDDDVKAVVLRIDSPGGSAFASELIRQEIIELREAGKPVIASMSSTAASGGYWIASAADQIVAAPTTITGSIGVFGLLMTFEDSLAHVGVHMDGISTTELPNINPGKELDEATRHMVQRSIEKVYADFLELVAEARSMSVDEVHNVAQGRVWTGQTALSLGLVDVLGELDTAIALAANQLGFEEGDFQVTWPEIEVSAFEAFVAEFFGVAHSFLPQRNVTTPEGLAEKALMQVWQDVKMLNDFNDRRGVYTRCLQCKVE